MVDRLLTGLTAQQKGTTARWYSNKTSLISLFWFVTWTQTKYGNESQSILAKFPLILSA